MYLISEKQENEEGNNENDNSNIINDNREEINNSILRINHINEDFFNRGFNIFLETGISPAELITLRHLFHLSAYHESVQRGQPFSWDANDMYDREERWLRAQRIINPDRNSYNYNNNFLNREIERDRARNYRGRHLIIRAPNRNYVQLFVRGEQNGLFRHRRFFGTFGGYESNFSFFCGILLGISFNFFTIFLLICFRFRQKLKSGLFLGMILSIFLIDIPLLGNKK